MSNLVNPLQVLPGSTLVLNPEWKMIRLGPITPSTTGLITVTLSYYDPGVPSFQFTIGGYNVKHIDTSVVKSVAVSAKSPQGVLISPGITYQTTDSPLGYNTKDLVQPQDSLTPWRLLETIRPAGGSSGKLIVDESVAAAGTGSGTYTPNLGIDYALFTGGISQDTLGTSPHDSYITVTDGNGRLMFKIRGALNSPFKIYIGPLAGTVNIAWANGDSVAHWFLLNIYETVA